MKVENPSRPRATQTSADTGSPQPAMTSSMPLCVAAGSMLASPQA